MTGLKYACSFPSFGEGRSHAVLCIDLHILPLSSHRLCILVPSVSIGVVCDLRAHTLIVDTYRSTIFRCILQPPSIRELSFSIPVGLLCVSADQSIISCLVVDLIACWQFVLVRTGLIETIKRLSVTQKYGLLYVLRKRNQHGKYVCVTSAVNIFTECTSEGILFSTLPFFCPLLDIEKCVCHFCKIS